MKEYLTHEFSADDPELISVIDELPLWAAPFGLRLLDLMKIKNKMKALDIGCGLGFPLIEVAQRLGNSSKVYGIDPWEAALQRAKQKIGKYKIKNVEVIKGFAEDIPFENSYFDLIISNNGINNVEDLDKTISECARVCKPGAQFVFTMNLENSMKEFYNVFEETLTKNKMLTEIDKMKKHIHEKRRPIDEIKNLLDEYGFLIDNIVYDKFYLRFADAYTLFNHSLIKYWFLSSWKQIIPEKDLESIFVELESKLNEIAAKDGEIKLTIPFAAVDAQKKRE